jgi:hypothetical protein
MTKLPLLLKNKNKYILLIKPYYILLHIPVNNPSSPHHRPSPPHHCPSPPYADQPVLGQNNSFNHQTRHLLHPNLFSHADESFGGRKLARISFVCRKSSFTPCSKLIQQKMSLYGDKKKKEGLSEIIPLHHNHYRSTYTTPDLGQETRRSTIPSLI